MIVVDWHFRIYTKQNAANKPYNNSKSELQTPNIFWSCHNFTMHCNGLPVNQKNRNMPYGIDTNK